MLLGVEGCDTHVVLVDTSGLGYLYDTNLRIEVDILRERRTLFHFRGCQRSIGEPTTERHSLRHGHVRCTVFIYQSRAARYFLCTDEGLAVRVVITHLHLRNKIRSFGSEERHVPACHREDQSSGFLFVVGPLHEMIETGLGVATIVVVDGSVGFTVFRYGHGVLTVLAGTDGELDSIVHRHGDGYVLHAVLRIVIGQTTDFHTGRQFAAFGQQDGIRILTEIDLEVLERPNDRFTGDVTDELEVREGEVLVVSKSGDVETDCHFASGYVLKSSLVLECRSTRRVIITQQFVSRNGGDLRLHTIYGVAPTVRSVVRTLFDSFILDAFEGKRNAFLHLNCVFNHDGFHVPCVGCSRHEGGHRHARVGCKTAFRALRQTCTDR